MSKQELSPQRDEVRTKMQPVGTISLAGLDCHTHKPLGNAGSMIRVVDVLPASRDDLTIAYKLREVNLDNIGAQYEAVSYVWGNANDRRPIRCDGQLLEVTVNCWDALFHLRQEDGVRTLWIDAICIDQRCDQEQSVQERNHQIELMGRVYQRASRVLVWLGLQDEGGRILELFDFCETVSNLEDDTDSTAEDDTDQATDDDAGLITEDIQTPLQERGPDFALDFLLITDSAWFFRMWTLQEIAFASEASLICGHQNLDWKAFWHGYDYVMKPFAAMHTYVFETLLLKPSTFGTFTLYLCSNARDLTTRSMACMES
ncbi:het-domain-containing protein [Apiospora saccharicola]|uniref:Het-domain-containing protein n=1 Tax=Apiospora saccharicola TaxID=335842 RepID=A0ABR1U2C1_9PEZI